MNADSWADYADVLATLSGGSLAGEPARAIDHALELDAQHPKALWLKASLAHEQGPLSGFTRRVEEAARDVTRHLARRGDH